MRFIVRLIARPFMSWSDATPAPNVAGGTTVAEQPVNLPTAIYLGVFGRAEQRVLQAIFKAIAAGGGKCVATLAMLASDSNTSKSTTRNAITQASRNRPSGKDRTPLLLRCFASKYSDLREALVRTMT
jgi:hypothetical protein